MSPAWCSRLAVLAVAPLVLSACAGSQDPTSASGQEPETMNVVASFYPLEFAAERIVGEEASVETLTSPGVDPHDAELSPQSVAGVKQADLVIYSAGLQPAVDQAVESQASDHAFDVNDAADLVEASEQEEHGGEDDHNHDHEDAGAEEQQEHADEERPDEEHDHGGIDPHFWLDPERMASVSQSIADQLSQADPDNAEVYQANVEELVTELTALKQEYDNGLASCAQEDMITTHEAFGYIARPYGFHQIAITGLTPDSEPSAGRLAEVSEIVETSGASTVYSEVLLGADIAQTVANETGAQVAVLDPVEGVSDDSPGEDYFEVMRANLEAVREGQACS